MNNTEKRTQTLLQLLEAELLDLQALDLAQSHTLLKAAAACLELLEYIPTKEMAFAAYRKRKDSKDEDA